MHYKCIYSFTVSKARAMVALLVIECILPFLFRSINCLNKHNNFFLKHDLYINTLQKNINELSKLNMNIKNSFFKLHKRKLENFFYVLRHIQNYIYNSVCTGNGIRYDIIGIVFYWYNGSTKFSRDNCKCIFINGLGRCFIDN